MVIPSYVLVGANISYDRPKYRLGIKINNLTNQKYWMGWTNMIPQMPRQVMATVAYKF
nr:TonB-dependent receptor [Cruoricaptor ignavus]